MPENDTPTLEIVEDPEALDKTREQAADAGADFAPITVTTKTGKTFTIPDPNLLDDDQQEAFDNLRYEANQCDRWPDIEVPEEVITGKDGTVVRTGAHTRPGDFIQPYQKDGKRMTPGYNIRLAKIFLGDDQYEKFKAAGGRSNEVALALSKRTKENRERQASDPKSDAGAAGDSPASASD